MRNKPRSIVPTNQFKRDVKKCHLELLVSHDWIIAMTALVNDEPLPEKFCDHALQGQLKGTRDCHIKPDLVLIYEKPDDETLLLIRIGSHSELKIS